MADIAEQNIIVTGANRGIGRAISERFVQEGAHVGLLGRNENAVQRTIEEIETNLSPPGSMSPIIGDVSEPSQIRDVLGEWIEEKGSVQTLVNNAGITRDGLIMRMKNQDWNSVLNTNLDGAFHCTKAVIRSMIRNRWGRIVMISSVSGLVGNPGQTNYSASKAGLIGLSKSLAREVGSRNITCNTIAPGYIETELTKDLTEDQLERLKNATPLGRFATGEDVAELALFLASERSRFITGEVIRVDGGFAM